MAATASIYLTLRVNKSLERLKSDLQRDVFKFSKWHEKRVEAVIAIYQAFETHLVTRSFLQQAPASIRPRPADNGSTPGPVRCRSPVAHGPGTRREE